jgi:glutamate-1-semialdehyde aminotransferase
MPWYFARGEGARLWDDNGREFIDLELGLGPTLLGHNHPSRRPDRALSPTLARSRGKFSHASASGPNVLG